MTDKLTAESIREVWSKATPGPWHVQDGELVYKYPPPMRAWKPVCGPADAEAIAAAPEHIAFLLAENERLSDEWQRALGVAAQEARHCSSLSGQLAAANKRIAELEEDNDLRVLREIRKNA